MNIIEHLAESVERTTGLKLHYQSLQVLNTIMDNVEYPCAHAFLLEGGGLVQENGRLKERITLAVCFTDMTDFDFNSIENEDILQQMKEYASRFVFGMQNDPWFRLVSVNSSERIYDRFDVIVTGYAVNITLEELTGIGECEMQ